MRRTGWDLDGDGKRNGLMWRKVGAGVTVAALAAALLAGVLIAQQSLNAAPEAGKKPVRGSVVATR
jgi:hypothetical protein